MLDLIFRHPLASTLAALTLACVTLTVTFQVPVGVGQFLISLGAAR